MYKFSNRIAICAILILISSISIFSQDRSEILSCQGDTFNYDGPPPRYVFGGPGPDGQITRTETGARRLDLAFQPRSVRVDPRVNEKIVFQASGSSGPWYAIYHYAGKAPPPDNGKYLLPVPAGQLPADSGEVDAWINPLNHYSYRGNPPKPPLAGPIKSWIKKLPASMELESRGMQEGFYWFTLQAEFGSGAARCYRTTSPVVIEVARSNTPELYVTVTAHSAECKPLTASAEVTLKYIRREDVRIDWEVRDPEDRDVTPPNSHGKTVTLGLPLKEGRYTFKATAYAGDLTRYDSKIATFTDCAPDPGSGAGLVYFQFEVPDRNKRGLIINPTEPEGWAGGDPNPRASAEHQSKYPTGHFPLFFPQTKGKSPVEGMEHNNTRQLNAIGDMLFKYPNLQLKIFGYADFERGPTYDNGALGLRRAQAVAQYLVYYYEQTYKESEKYDPNISQRITSDRVIESRSDRFAQSCKPYRWNDPRRWDRRAEMLYTQDKNIEPPVYPEAKPCPQPVVTRKPTPRKKPARPGRRK